MPFYWPYMRSMPHAHRAHPLYRGGPWAAPGSWIPCHPAPAGPWGACPPGGPPWGPGPGVHPGRYLIILQFGTPRAPLPPQLGPRPPSILAVLGGTPPMGLCPMTFPQENAPSGGIYALLDGSPRGPVRDRISRRGAVLFFSGFLDPPRGTPGPGPPGIPGFGAPPESGPGPVFGCPPGGSQPPLASASAALTSIALLTSIAARQR